MFYSSNKISDVKILVWCKFIALYFATDVSAYMDLQEAIYCFSLLKRT